MGEYVGKKGTQKKVEHFEKTLTEHEDRGMEEVATWFEGCLFGIAFNVSFVMTENDALHIIYTSKEFLEPMRIVEILEDVVTYETITI